MHLVWCVEIFRNLFPKYPSQDQINKRHCQDAQEKDISKETLISTCSMSILAMSFIYLVLGWVFRKEITEYFHTPDQVHFLILFLFILSIDAFSTIPSAVLRLEGKPLRYVVSKVAGSVIYFGLVVFFINILPNLPNGFLGLKYDAEFGVGYVFLLSKTKKRGLHAVRQKNSNHSCDGIPIHEGRRLRW